jgi:hypothetical protein
MSAFSQSEAGAAIKKAVAANCAIDRLKWLQVALAWRDLARSREDIDRSREGRTD